MIRYALELVRSLTTRLLNDELACPYAALLSVEAEGLRFRIVTRDQGVRVTIDSQRGAFGSSGIKVHGLEHPCRAYPDRVVEMVTSCVGNGRLPGGEEVERSLVECPSVINHLNGPLRP